VKVNKLMAGTSTVVGGPSVLLFENSLPVIFEASE
jgi:hypothetical protein